MLTRPRQLETRSLLRAGFTLVEMLVAVALVLLMMTMFAEIFTLATSSMGKQKALAELDQRQRLMSTLLRDDLQKRSFRTLIAFHPTDDPSFVPSVNRPGIKSFDDRQGYFYISENDPDNDADDVLQITVRRVDGSLFFGRTRELLDPGTPGMPPIPPQGASANPNQPENDDGAYFGDGLGVGTARSAEVAYFLRNGTLYRRICLIRQPTNANYDDTPRVGAGTASDTALIQAGIYPQGSTIYVSGASLANRYPQDFDNSATNIYFASPPQLVILGEDSLSNALLASLGRPHNRFGFLRPTGLPPAAGYPVGKPLEYLPTGDFIGRFTHEETSHTAFAWPGDPGLGGDGTIATGDDTNPYTRTGLTLNVTGSVANYANIPPDPNSRQGEDILLTNVQSFDVKIWDQGASLGPDGAYGIAGIDDDNADLDNNNATGADDVLELGWPGSDDGAWADIGHTGLGYFSQTPYNMNLAYGPLAGGNRCFDTWHPSLGTSLGYAPFRPAFVGTDGAYGQVGVDDDNSDGDGDPATGADDTITELGWPNSDDRPIEIKAIKIRIRYLDLSSGSIREISIIEQLTPEIL